MSELLSSEKLCEACAHPDRHHFDDGHGNIVCRSTTECACVHRAESVARTSKCAVVAGVCPKPERTYGEPHYCAEPEWHEGTHRCRQCSLEFTLDPGSLVVRSERI